MTFLTVVLIGSGVVHAGIIAASVILTQKKEPTDPLLIPLNDTGSPYRTSAIMSEASITKKINDVVPWLWYEGGSSRQTGFKCPKCLSIRNPERQNHPKICDCSDYSKKHYHYQCLTCDYNAIMRTADDKG